MFLSAHHVAMHCDQPLTIDRFAQTRRVRFTWIKGHRFGGIRRL